MEKSFVVCSKRAMAVIVVLFLCVPLYAQEDDTYQGYWWRYSFTDKWEQTDEAIACRNLVHWLYSKGPQVKIHDRTYTAVLSEPMPIVTSKRKERMDGRWYALGIRKDDGRVYADLQEYQEYLSRPFNWENEQPSFGTADYIPYYKTEEGEVILYDYNMEIGDKYISMEGHDDVSIVAKDTVVLSDKREHRRLTLSNGLVLIEDVGCINGFPLDYLNPLPLFNGYFSFLQDVSSVDGNLIYITDLIVQDLDVFSHINNTEVSCRLIDYSIYNLQGRRLTCEPEKGMYIKNGRKYLKR